MAEPPSAENNPETSAEAGEEASVAGGTQRRSKPRSELAPRHKRWLEEVELLMGEEEREVFDSLAETYQRDHFIRRFWKVRDPFPQTPRNEMREDWEARAELARESYEDLRDDRARMLLQLGEPTRRRLPICRDLLRRHEIWVYSEGVQGVTGSFSLVFYDAGRSYQLWQPMEGLVRLVGPWMGAATADSQAAEILRRRCPRAEELLSDLAHTLDLSRAEGRRLIPQAPQEWAAAFRARTTDLAVGTEALPAQLELAYPGRHQSRTVVQGLVTVPRAEAKSIGPAGAEATFRFVVDGEILREEELFDQFRFRFDMPVALLEEEEQIPLVLQRYLRPGSYRLILKVEDLISGRAYREERDLEVPRVERRPPAAAPVQTAATDSGLPDPVADGEAVEMNTELLGGTLREANASLSQGDWSVRLLPMPEELAVGKLRVEARTRGEGISRVAFELDGRLVMRKVRPPYSVEVDLGDTPQVRTLRAVALGAEGEELASDEVLVNAGPHRFDLRLIEPRPGGSYRSSVRARAEVEMPEGERLDRVEFFLNETLLTTLYQPPFEQPILLPRDTELAYVRAVAHLDNGSSTEDVVFINAPDYIDSMDVHLVELYTTVVDRRGDFVDGLTVDDFKVTEDGIEQSVRRFERVTELPIHAGIVLDTSISMVEELREVERAAYRFLETVLTDRDRGAVITFNDAPKLAARFTGDKGILAGALAGLVAEGETAFYDSVIFALHYFSGLPGKRAIVVLTDGEDSKSTYRYRDMVDYAHRTGVAVYVIGLELGSTARETRMRLRRLANDTGGECFFVDRAAQLERVYSQIEQELRSQYLLAYQSSQGGSGSEFRRVDVKVQGRGLEAKTLQGYFP